MKPARWFSLLTLLTLGASGHGDVAGPVVVIPLRNEVSEAQFFFLRRALKAAERENASAFVIDMETYGGEVKAAISQMDALLKTRVPTFTYVNNKAISAGALIAIATQKIYMSPTAVIGAAAPVLSGGEDLPKTMTEKTVSTLSAMARAASQQNGHNPDIAAAFISKEKQLKIGETVIDDAESLLTLSAQEAAQVYNSKPLLAAGIAGTLEEMLDHAGLQGTVDRMEPTGFERLAFWITALSPLLLVGGMIGGYIEFKMPGFGIPGLVSIVCFGLFFLGHYVAGLAGWEVAVCFAIGVALLIGEFIVHPGTILPGLAGVVLMLGALVYAMVDHWPSQPVWPSQDLLLRPLLNLSLAIAAAGFAMYLLARYLPRTAAYGRMVLSAEVPSGPAITIPLTALRVGAGLQGKAHTTLRPSGKAEFENELLDVVSQGEFIPAGAPVRIVLVEGTKVVVEAA